jgi:hypothetical protein
LAAELGLTLLANPVRSVDPDGAYHVILDRSAPTSKVRVLQKKLEQDDIFLEISYYGQQADAFRNAIQESISNVFSNDVEGVTIIKSGGTYHVFVLASSNSNDITKRVEDHVERIRLLFDAPSVSVKVDLDAGKPTATEFLATARRKAPATCEAMQSELAARGFPGLSLEWVNHQFDRLRKGNLLHRQPDRTYVLTHAGLQALGSGKGRNSPDVMRLLDLARREN